MHGGALPFALIQEAASCDLSQRPKREVATHEWKPIETMEEAELLARNARNPQAKKRNPSAGKPTKPSAGKPTTNPQFHSGETHTTAMVGKPTLAEASELRRVQGWAMVARPSNVAPLR